MNRTASRPRWWAVIALAVVAVGTILAALPAGVASAEAAAAESPWWDRDVGAAQRSTIEANPVGGGYWIGFDGAGVRSVHGAPTLGTATDKGGMVVPFHKGNGYWLVTLRGQITAFGDAPALCGGHMSNCTGHKGDRDIVAVAASPTSDGFWAVNEDKFVWAVGDVAHHGQWRDSASSVTDIVATPSGKGYYVLMADGGVSTHGDAVFFGSTGGKLGSARTAVGLALHRNASGSVDGYWMAVDDGSVQRYGAATDLGASPASFDTGRGRLVGIAATPDGSGFAVLQNGGNVTAFPTAGAPDPVADTRRALTCTGQPLNCGITFGATVAVENRSSGAVRVSPRAHSASSVDGFQSTGTADLSAVPWDTTLEVAAGSSTPTWPLSFTRRTDGSTDTRLIVDVTPGADSSDRHRLELNQSRGVIHRVRQTTLGGIYPENALELLTAPTTSITGSGTLRVRLEETVVHTGPWAARWTLIVEDVDGGQATTTVSPTVTRLTRAHTSSDTGRWDLLKRPVYRIDVPSMTRTWDDQVPSRVSIEPTAVSARAPYQDAKLGTLTPISTPVVDESARTITFGATSFYYQDPDDTIVPLKAAAGQTYVIEPDGHLGTALDHLHGTSGVVTPVPRTSGSANQHWTLVSGSGGSYSLQNAGSCLSGVASDPGALMIAPCNGSDPAQQWKLTDNGRLGHQIASVQDGRVLSYRPGTLAPDLGSIGRSPLGQAGEVQHWNLTDPTSHTRPAIELHLSGGWLGDATVSLAGRPEPSLSLAGTTLTGLALRPTSADAKPALVANGINAEEGLLEIQNASVVVSPTSKLGEIYDYAFFRDGSDRLITGLDDGDGSLMVTTERARHLNAPRPGAATAVDADATRNRVYVSTTREAATQTVKPQIAISGQRIDSSGGLSISSHRELARLGTGSVATGVSLQCSLSGGTYNSCEPVDLSAGAALYRDAKGGLRVMVRATTLLSTTNPAIGPEHSIGMFAGRVWSVTGWQLAGDTPPAASVPQGVNPRLDIPAITRSGTLTNGDVGAW